MDDPTAITIIDGPPVDLSFYVTFPTVYMYIELLSFCPSAAWIDQRQGLIMTLSFGCSDKV